MRFSIAYGKTAPLLKAIGLLERHAYVEVDDVMVTVSMGWGFQSDIGRESITSVELYDTKHASIGVHGWRGRWLVNGKAGDLVRIMIDPATSARVGPVPVKLTELLISLDNREDFVALFDQ